MVHLNRLANKKKLIIAFWSGVRQSKKSHEPKTCGGEVRRLCDSDVRTPGLTTSVFIEGFLQGYAARDSFLLTVPLFCGVLLCAPRNADTASGMRTPLSLRDREFVSFGYIIKRKTPHEVV